MADVSVRPARVQDAPAVAALTLQELRARLPQAALPDEASAVDQWAASISAPGAYVLLVALAGEQVVGYVSTGPGDGPGAEIGELVVGPHTRRQGHGSRLLAAVVDTVRERGETSAYTWVDEADEVRARFLDSAGFSADGTVRELDLDGTAAVVVREQRWSALLA